ncbi:MAG: GTP cyclohydrolase I FolE [Proteobacteria bacterium]|nr:GTP cyclohydrolase I FolE [Pseudomonadota bacterium]
MILEGIGEDLDREGLRETPLRVAKFYEEVFAFTGITNDEIAKMFGKTFTAPENSGPVIVHGIKCFSFCEHHIALMYDMEISIGYIPRGCVLGLSKLSRIADAVCRRLQLQERIGSDIAEIIHLATGSDCVAVKIKATHSCVSARGIKKEQPTYTYTTYGDAALLLSLLNED